MLSVEFFLIALTIDTRIIVSLWPAGFIHTLPGIRVIPLRTLIPVIDPLVAREESDIILVPGFAEPDVRPVAILLDNIVKHDHREF